MPVSFIRRALLALALAGSLLLAPATAAEAAPKKPTKATKIRVATNTTAMSIRWKKPKRAAYVHICVKTSAKSRCIRSVRTRKNHIRFSHLKANSGTDFYFRIRSHYRKRTVSTSWRRANLKVGKGPANRMVSGSGDYLGFNWSRATNASSFQIQVSTNRTFSSGTRTESRRGTGANVRGLNGGMTYFARVRGANGPVLGPWGPVTRVVLPAVPVQATVSTYNLCGENRCRSADSGAWFLRNVPAWATRKPLASALIRTASPDVIATQESATKTAFHQVLPGYSRGAYKSAKQTYFKSSRFTALDGGWMTLNATTKRYATWDLLRDRATGTAFIVANAHLEPYKGAAKDKMRHAQTTRLISKINAVNPHQLPVVWAGDWNSNASNANQSNYPGGFDGPKTRFATSGIVNALEQTSNVTHGDLNSANQGELTPKAHRHHVDAIYVPQTGVRVEAWAMLANFLQPEPETGRQYATPFPSDHNPVVARLVIATG